MIFGYAPVSTKDQNLDGQHDALKAAGAVRIFADTITGTGRSRPELDRLLRRSVPGMWSSSRSTTASPGA